MVILQPYVHFFPVESLDNVVHPHETRLNCTALHVKPGRLDFKSGPPIALEH